MNSNAPEYVALIESFLLQKIGAKQFEQEFLRLFKSDKISYSEDIFDALDTLFGAVDEYCDDPQLRSKLPRSLDEQELLVAANLALKRLQQA